MKKFRITAALAAILALSMVFMASAGALALNHDHDHDDKHQHTYIFRGTETRVLPSDQTSCATIQVACYVCSCGSMIETIIDGTYRSGAHEFQYRTSIPGGGGFDLPVINWVCKHCGYVTYNKPPQPGVIM